MMDKGAKILLPGGAGLVGQNLVALMGEAGYRNIVVLDKNAHNLALLRQLHPQVMAEVADIAEAGEWMRHFENAAAVVMLQAQIGGTDEQAFTRNNIDSTTHVLEACRKHGVNYIVHISSSVLKSSTVDFYTKTKGAQEEMVAGCGIPHIILRPTLMFGWCDRKHLGWLARFMKKLHIMPVPGDGLYLRQPLYARDFCRIILRCLEERKTGAAHDISGQERISYIEIMRAIRRTSHARAVIFTLPKALFRFLLQVWGLFDRNPPFTPQQLDSLVANDIFPVEDWPRDFGVPATPFAAALDETFNHPVYSNIALKF